MRRIAMGCWALLPRGGLRVVLLGVVLAGLLASPAHAVERRRPQFQTEPAYLVVPFPYSLPGIGEGIAWSALGANVLGTHADVYALAITGDAQGTGLGVEDLHLLSERLILNFFRLDLNKAAVNNYETRGMQSQGDDYQLLEASRVENLFAELRLTFLDRSFEVFVRRETSEADVVRVRNPDGSLVSEFAQPVTGESERNVLGVLLDFTDDYADPRKGWRVQVLGSRSPPTNADQPDFVVYDLAVNGYIPIGKISTLVLHYFQSDASVSRKGNTDAAAILAERDLQCGPTDTACQQIQQRLIDQEIAARSNGTATTLGGEQRLRSYPMDRYQGAHAVFYAAELRWNITEEATPFDYFIWKDVRTNVQLALFYETGSVGETRNDVGNTYRSSYGGGVRMVSGSGFVYRGDVATGDEGGEVIITFSYPF